MFLLESLDGERRSSETPQSELPPVLEPVFALVTDVIGRSCHTVGSASPAAAMLLTATQTPKHALLIRNILMS